MPFKRVIDIKFNVSMSNPQRGFKMTEALWNA